MTALIELTDTLSMAGQIQPADVAQLAAAGYETIICNRPDDEEPHQPSMTVLKKPVPTPAWFLSVTPSMRLHSPVMTSPLWTMQ